MMWVNWIAANVKRMPRVEVAARTGAVVGDGAGGFTKVGGAVIVQLKRRRNHAAPKIGASPAGLEKCLTNENE